MHWTWLYPGLDTLPWWCTGLIVWFFAAYALERIFGMSLIMHWIAYLVCHWLCTGLHTWNVGDFALEHIPNMPLIMHWNMYIACHWLSTGLIVCFSADYALEHIHGMPLIMHWNMYMVCHWLCTGLHTSSSWRQSAEALPRFHPHTHYPRNNAISIMQIFFAAHTPTPSGSQRPSLDSTFIHIVQNQCKTF